MPNLKRVIEVTEGDEGLASAEIQVVELIDAATVYSATYSIKQLKRIDGARNTVFALVISSYGTVNPFGYQHHAGSVSHDNHYSRQWAENKTAKAVGRVLKRRHPKEIIVFLPK